MLKRLTHLGVDESLPRHATRHVVLTNQYALFLFASMVLSAVGPDRLTLLPEVRLLLASSIPLVAATFVMNWRGLHTVATTWLLSVYFVVMGRIAMLEPLETNHAVILLINAMVAWFLLPPSRMALRLIITIPSAAAAIALPLWLKAYPPPPQLPTFDIERIAFGNMALITVALVFIAIRSATEIARAETELLAERQKTETLLKREVAYQVAERSRELGAAASRAERAAFLEPSANFSARYETVRPLGEGGMASVFEVSRKTDGKRMALKVMKGSVSADLAARFAREAEIGARVQHANLVEILDVGVTDAGAPFLAMELLPGGSLEGQRERFGDVPWAVGVIRDIARGIAALHDAGVVHRDLKPANVLLDEGRVRVADYGIARLSPGELSDTVSSGPGVTRTGHWVGTPLYMAPEAANGSKNVGAAADMFALGLIAHELFTKRHPFGTPPVMLLMAGLPLPTVPPLAVTGVGPDVLRLVDACLAQDPGARPTALELLSALGQ